MCSEKLEITSRKHCIEDTHSHLCSDFPFWSRLLKSQRLRPVHQWVYYKLLAADLCLVPMLHELNWKMPWGGRLAISSGSTFYLSPFSLHSGLSGLRDWETFGWYKRTPRKGVYTDCGKPKDAGEGRHEDLNLLESHSLQLGEYQMGP